MAHPDDETLFFGGLLQKCAKNFFVACLTDGGADNRAHERRDEFSTACLALGVTNFRQFSLPDIYEQRLESSAITEILSDLDKSLPDLEEVYTHNSIGEYGHPHHQDISAAVHLFFDQRPVWSPAYNCYPTKIISLSESEYQIKQNTLTDIYQKETSRFLNLVSCQYTEGFLELDKEQVKKSYESKNFSKVDQFKKVAELDCYKKSKRIF